jgi:hypothetical protein
MAWIRSFRTDLTTKNTKGLSGWNARPRAYSRLECNIRDRNFVFFVVKFRIGTFGAFCASCGHCLGSIRAIRVIRG